MIKFLRYAGLFLVFAFFIVGGVSHFTSSELFVHIMPPMIPFKLEIVYLTGVIEIVAALCLLFHPWRRSTGNFLILFTLAVTPVNIYMWMNPERFPEVEPVFLSIRLVLQVVLIALIWWSTRTNEPRSQVAP